MIDREKLRIYGAVQAKAKAVLARLPVIVEPGMSEADVANSCVRLLAEDGVYDTWYYQVPAFVLIGDRTTMSLSGREYVPSAEKEARLGDLVTVDLSPSINNYWGDCARSFPIGGKASLEIHEGMNTEVILHTELVRIAHPDMTFDELYERMNGKIAELGYENLDFSGNLGHSIERERDARRYIEQGNRCRLGDVALFTFEPHIRKPRSRQGFKHENIYYFGDDALCEL